MRNTAIGPPLVKGRAGVFSMSDFQASGPKPPLKMAKLATKPRPMETEAAKKLTSILGPSFKIFFRSHRSSIRNSMA